MTTTYDCIATTTLTNTASSVTFSSISGTYTDLVLVINGLGSTAVNGEFRLNSDTGSNYSINTMYGRAESLGTPGAARTNNRTTGAINLYTAFTTSTLSNIIVHFFDYSNTTTYKSAISRAITIPGDNTFSGNEIITSVWRNTSAVTSITCIAANFATSCVFSLYGIKAE